MSDNQLAAILFSHGSILPGSGAMLNAHVAAMRALGRFAAVEAGYLNYSEPPIEAAVETCLRAGAERIVIVPYFLVAGKFVTVDLPARLDAIRRANPEVDFVMARAIEDAPQMLEIVRDLVTECQAGNSIGSDACATPAGTDSSNTDEQRRGLLLVLHGSPRPEANRPAIAIADQLAATSEFAHVGVGYLECNKPDIAAAIAQTHAAGVIRLDVVPYFLHPGRHLTQDIPRIITAARQEFPEMRIRVCKSVGASARLLDVLMARVDEAVG